MTRTPLRLCVWAEQEAAVSAESDRFASKKKEKRSKTERERCHLITALQWEEPRTGTVRVCVLWEEAESMIGSDRAEDE